MSITTMEYTTATKRFDKLGKLFLSILSLLIIGIVLTLISVANVVAQTSAREVSISSVDFASDENLAAHGMLRTNTIDVVVAAYSGYAAPLTDNKYVTAAKVESNTEYTIHDVKLTLTSASISERSFTIQEIANQSIPVRFGETTTYPHVKYQYQVEFPEGVKPDSVIRYTGIPEDKAIWSTSTTEYKIFTNEDMSWFNHSNITADDKQSTITVSMPLQFSVLQHLITEQEKVAALLDVNQIIILTILGFTVIGIPLILAIWVIATRKYRKVIDDFNSDETDSL